MSTLLATFVAFCVVSVVSGSYCGQSAIPYAIEILPNGQPVLGCARPTCFGWTADGKRSADAALFYRIGAQMDGYLRSSDKAGPAVKNASLFQPQFAVCERSYLSDRCVGPSQWLGGIAPSPKVDSRETLKVMCCEYDKLRFSMSKGALKIRPGQSMSGGEMRNEMGRQHAFEYISSIDRMFDEHGVVYTVQMRSFNCVPEPNGPAEVDEKAEKMLVDNIDAIDHPTTTPRSASTTKNAAKFDEKTFELPEELSSDNPQIPNRKVPIARAYEEGAERSYADSDSFRARARGVPSAGAQTPLLINGGQSGALKASHSPQYGQQQQYPPMGTNPLDPFGLFAAGPHNPFGWVMATSPPPPAAKLLPLEIPSPDDIEKAIPESGRRIIEGVARTFLSL